MDLPWQPAFPIAVVEVCAERAMAGGGLILRKWLRCSRLRQS